MLFVLVLFDSDYYLITLESPNPSKDVKERILEHMAVSFLKGSS